MEKFSKLEGAIDLLPLSYVAKLIARSLLRYGYDEDYVNKDVDLSELSIAEQDAHIYSLRQEVLTALINDIKSENLKTNTICRDMVTGELFPEETYVDWVDLERWLDERVSGQWYWDEGSIGMIHDFYGDLFSWIERRSELLIRLLDDDEGARAALCSDDPHAQDRFILERRLNAYRERFGDLDEGMNTSLNDSPMERPLGRASQKHRERCRAIAELKWQSEPDITIADMVISDEITVHGCQEKHYGEKTIRGWINDLAPNRSPGRRQNSKS